MVAAAVAAGIAIGGVLAVKKQVDEVTRLQDPLAAETYVKQIKAKVVPYDDLLPGYWYITFSDDPRYGVPAFAGMTRAYDSYDQARTDIDHIEKRLTDQLKFAIYNQTGVDFTKLSAIYIRDQKKLDDLAIQQMKILMIHGKFNPGGPFPKSVLASLKNHVEVNIQKGRKAPQEALFHMQAIYKRAKIEWDKAHPDKIARISY